MRLGLKLAFNSKRCSLHFQLNVANPDHADVAKKLVDMAQKVLPAATQHFCSQLHPSRLRCHVSSCIIASSLYHQRLRTSVFRVRLTSAVLKVQNSINNSWICDGHLGSKSQRPLGYGVFLLRSLQPSVATMKMMLCAARPASLRT